MLPRVFNAQLRNPRKGDWSTIVMKDLEDFKINLTFEKIRKMSELTFKKKVVEACKEYSFNELIKEMKRKNIKKGNKIKYNKLGIQKYLITNKLTSHEIKFLFRIRTKMLNVKTNFSHMYPNSQECEKCNEGLPDNQDHIPLCNGLKTKVNINYNDLFSSDVEVMKKALTGFEAAWNQRLENV